MIRAASGSGPELGRMVLVYESAECERRGQEACRRLRVLAGVQEGMDLDSWKFDMLRQAGMRVLADDELRRARLVLVAVLDPGPLPVEVVGWLRAGLGGAGNGVKGVGLVMDAEWDEGVGVKPVEDEVRLLAEQVGLVCRVLRVGATGDALAEPGETEAGLSVLAGLMRDGGS